MSPSPSTPAAVRWRARRAASGTLRRALATAATVVLVGALLSAAAPGAGAATSATQLGIDVSAHNHPGGTPINWRSVRASGVRFTMVKATEGAGRPSTAGTNSWFDDDWKGARAAGLLRGAYHYARPRYPMTTATTDARRFVAFVKAVGAGSGELAPALDLEETGGLSKAALTGWVSSWLKEVTRLTGGAPAIYTGRGFWTSYLGDTTAFAGYPLWLAHHTGAAQPYRPPGGWVGWTFWQYSSTGRVAGVPTPVDLNRSCASPGVAPTRRDGPCSGSAPPTSTSTSSKTTSTKTTSTKTTTSKPTTSKTTSSKTTSSKTTSSKTTPSKTTSRR